MDLWWQTTKLTYLYYWHQRIWAVLAVWAVLILLLISGVSLVVGTLFSFGVVGYLLRMSAAEPVAAAVIVMVLSGLYYKHRIGGITGDCFGALS